MNPLYNEPICTEGRCHFYSIQPSLKSAEWCVVTTFDILVVGLPSECIAVYHFRIFGCSSYTRRNSPSLGRIGGLEHNVECVSVKGRRHVKWWASDGHQGFMSVG